MPILNLFAIDQQGKSPTVTAQRHLNLYAEISGDKSRLAFYGTPGLTLFTSFGDTPARGWIEIGEKLYAVHRCVLYEVDNSGATTNRGTLSTTSGRVWMAYNGTQIGIVDGTSMYVYTVATNAFVTVSSGLFANPIDITFQDSYFICCFANSGRFQISAGYDGTTFDALDFATAESNPDNLLRVLADHGELVLCGAETIEFWSNNGTPDFPYSRVTTIEFGLAAPNSLVKYNDSLAGIFTNKMGQVSVMILAGHAPQKISTPEIDAILNGYSSVSEATAFSYMLGGHPMLQINFTAANKSWLYDSTTQLWSPLESSGGRHRADMHINFLSVARVADYSNGNIYNLDPNVYTDNGAPIAREIITRHFQNNYNWVRINRVQVDMETGVGLVSGQGSDPQVMLQVSKDNGRTWPVERWGSIGKIGAYLTRVFWTRLGRARDWVLKFRVTDPVKVVITGISVDAE